MGAALARSVDARLLDDDEDMTLIDRIPAPLLHLPPPPAKRKPSVIPPPLPLSLRHRLEPARLTDSDEAWLETLPLSTRAVLEAARCGTSEWPLAPRLSHAIARPV